MFLTKEQNESNDKIICELIEKYWGLSKESTNKFKEAILKKDYPKEYTCFNLDENGRAFFKLTNEILKDLDEGWEDFKRRFFDVVDSKNLGLVTYENFRQNLILIDKQKIKLTNWLNDVIYKRFISLKPYSGSRENIAHRIGCAPRGKETILKENIKKYIEFQYSYINISRLPKKDIYLVLSCNFVDWFLCSTGEKWVSCLNLNKSYGYWTGMPSLAMDKNRAMVYITTGEQKKYNNLISYKMISRSWVILMKDEDRETIYHFVLEYPDKGSSTLQNIAENILKVSFIDSDEGRMETKYSIDLLFSEVGKYKFYTFVYLDTLVIKAKKAKKFYFTNEVEGDSDSSRPIIIYRNNKKLSYDDPSINPENYENQDSLDDIIKNNSLVFSKDNMEDDDNMEHFDE